MLTFAGVNPPGLIVTVFVVAACAAGAATASAAAMVTRIFGVFIGLDPLALVPDVSPLGARPELA
jgi:hypothetical protein